MIFGWFKKRRRQRLKSRPFPAAWQGYIDSNFAQFAELSPERQNLIRDRLRIFIAEKYWEGVAGVRVTEEMQVTIAAMACLLTVAFDEEEALYPKVLTVLIHEETYARQTRRSEGGIVSEGAEFRLGEAWNFGPVALSWPAVVQGGRSPHDGRNLVYHEFSHVLDMTGGTADGIPPLPSSQAEHDWVETFRREFEAMRRAFQAGYAIPLDSYAITEPGEFFAVATESYFERPRLLLVKCPELYEMLNSFYRLDTANW